MRCRSLLFCVTLVTTLSVFADGRTVKEEDKTVQTDTVGVERGGSLSLGNNTDKLTVGAKDDASLTSKTTVDNVTGSSKTENTVSQGDSQSIGVSHKDGNTTYSGTASASSSTTTKDDGSTTATSGMTVSGGQTTVDTRKNSDGSTTKLTHGEKANIGSNVSSDGTGSATVGIGENYKVENTRQYGQDGGTGGETHGSTEANAGAKYSAGTTENGVSVTLEGDISVRGKAGASGQVGTDEYNIHGSGEIEVSAELVAKLQAVAEMSPDGTVTVKAGEEIGAAASLEGTIKGGVTLMGVPLDVVLTGGVSVGAKASANAGFEFDATTGKAKLTLEASAVLGAGAQGSITVEVGAEQLKELLIGQTRDAVEKIVTEMLGGDQTEYIKDLLNSHGWEEMMEKIIRHELEEMQEGVRNATVKNALDWVKNGASAGDVFQYVDAIKKDDSARWQAILRKIANDIKNARNKESGDPLNGEPEGGGTENDSGSTSSQQSQPVGLTPFKVY